MVRCWGVEGTSSALLHRRDAFPFSQTCVYDSLFDKSLSKAVLSLRCTAFIIRASQKAPPPPSAFLQYILSCVKDSACVCWRVALVEEGSPGRAIPTLRISRPALRLSQSCVDTCPTHLHNGISTLTPRLIIETAYFLLTCQPRNSRGLRGGGPVLYARSNTTFRYINFIIFLLLKHDKYK